MRKKNNESVRKTREKKRLEEELEKTKNHEEKIALREIVKVVIKMFRDHSISPFRLCWRGKLNIFEKLISLKESSHQAKSSSLAEDWANCRENYAKK